ncbi:hypothetical protein [Sphingobacterium arenae]|uniref:Lasso RiPP family leader peptide-containing protein n=1 Tax=Sphingobacterium arenae TaxID=1280598 RepID=A0ABR7XZN9_9SPHI|nr:hypothetical protein [Sphingobacterium arenae]MBD1424515.1 hypothetical protein [Sphingobacterium arenae]
MKKTKSTKNLDTKLSYEAPVLRSMEIELEYGIASGSAAPSTSHQWNTTETQTQEVQNNHW